MCVYYLIRRAHAKHNKKKSSRNQTNKMVLFIIRLPCLRNRRSKKRNTHWIKNLTRKKHLHSNLFIFFVFESRKCNWIEKTTHKMHLLLLHLAIGYLSYFIWLLLASQEMHKKKTQYVQWSNQLNTFFVC